VSWYNKNIKLIPSEELEASEPLYDDPFDNVDWGEVSLYASWKCTMCEHMYIDQDEHTDIIGVPENMRPVYSGVEKQMYWLGPGQIICKDCAVTRGIPPIEEED
jgi:hypothetical protein